MADQEKGKGEGIMLIIKLLSMFDFLYKYNIYNIYVYRQIDR